MGEVTHLLGRRVANTVYALGGLKTTAASLVVGVGGYLSLPMFNKDEEKGLAYDGRGSMETYGENLRVVLAEFST